MNEKFQPQTAHEMCRSFCSYFSMNSGGCRNQDLFRGMTPEEIQEARERRAKENGCNQAQHLGKAGSMVYKEGQWKFIFDAPAR